MAKEDRKARKTAARKVRRRLADIDPTACHQQRQSPLFGVLPPELRNHIFEMALLRDVDLTRYYRYYHFEFPVKKLHLNLFRTCRLVYYETRSIPLQKYAIVSMYPYVEIHTVEPGPTKIKYPLRFDCLTKTVQRAIQMVTIAAPSLDRTDVQAMLSLKQFTPRVLTLCIGRRDLRRKYAKYVEPVRAIKFNKELEQLKVCIYDRRSSKADLLAVIGPNRDEWTIDRKDGQQLQLVGVEYITRGDAEAEFDDWCEGCLTWKLATLRKLFSER